MLVLSIPVVRAEAMPHVCSNLDPVRHDPDPNQIGPQICEGCTSAMARHSVIDRETVPLYLDHKDRTGVARRIRWRQHEEVCVEQHISHRNTI